MPDWYISLEHNQLACYVIWSLLLVFILGVLIWLARWKAEDYDNIIKGLFIGLLGFMVLFLIVGLFHVPEMCSYVFRAGG
jgi:hypothetical protein